MSDDEWEKCVGMLLEYVFERPLYAMFEMDYRTYSRFCQIVRDGLELRWFCPECGAITVYSIARNKYAWQTPQYNCELGQSLILQCGMNSNHQIVIYHQTGSANGNRYIQKIGQHPPLADLHHPHLKKYKSLLERYHSELERAVGLATHGIGIGSYVYLRRIIEMLIEEAHVKAAASPGWDESAYTKSRVVERISMLGHLLPDFLSENKESYAILSKGLHELGEEECREYFPVLLKTIEFILDEKLAEAELAKKKAEVKKQLQSAHQKLK